jgi:hypothetical protein
MEQIGSTSGALVTRQALWVKSCRLRKLLAVCQLCGFPLRPKMLRASAVPFGRRTSRPA